MEAAPVAAYDAMPESRRVAALGDCAVGCAVLADAAELGTPLAELLPVDLRIPGCPPSPQQIADAILRLGWADMRGAGSRYCPAARLPSHELPSMGSAPGAISGRRFCTRRQ
jgi:Ni,Fe-hydrogenase III small subunit